MRHGMSYRKLGRTSAHRAALFRNQLASLIEHERIVTTLPKAKELRPLIEKMVTLAKEDSVHNRRQAARSVQNEDLITRLFETLSPRFRERPGGYTRIIKLGPRRGDGAEMAILEFVDYELKTPAPETPKGRKKAAPKKEAADEEGAEPEEGEEKPKKKAAPRKPAPKKKPAKTSAAKKGAPRKGGTKGGKRGS